MWAPNRAEPIIHRLRPKNRDEATLLACGLLPSLFFLVGGMWGTTESSRLTGLIAAYGAGALPYLYLYRHWTRFPNDGHALTRLLAASTAARLVLLFLPPLLSEDLWRYLWDGAVQWEGINPYLHAPISTAVDEVANSPVLAAVRAQIGHAHIPTIYPPAAQLAFAGATAWTVSEVVLRLVMVAADVLVVFGLWRWSALRGTAPQVALLYGFAPLAVAESAIGGHVDSVGVAALVLAGGALTAGRWGRAGLALAVSVGVKLMPVLALPTLLRRHKAAVLVTLLGCVALGLPYLEAGGELSKGLQSYGHRWRANDGLFALLMTGFEQIWPSSPTPVELSPEIVRGLRVLVGPSSGALPNQIWPDELAFGAAKLVVGCLFGLVILRRLWRSETLEDFFGPVVMALLLLSPVVHPWYLLWGLPFALLSLARGTTDGRNPERDVHGSEPSSWAKPYLLWSSLVFIAYLPRPQYLDTGRWVNESGFTLLEYGPVWALLLAAWLGTLRRRRRHSGT